jgi:hypothetical protein
MENEHDLTKDCALEAERINDEFDNQVEKWSVSKVDGAENLGIIEFQAADGEYHNFYILDNGERLVFGGAVNTGFLESGFFRKDDCFSQDENLSSLLEDLETYYREGYQYTTVDFICNDRM